MARDAAHGGPRSDYTYDPNLPDKVTSAAVKNPFHQPGRSPTWQSWQYDYYQATDPAPGALHHVYRVEDDGTTRDTISTYVYDTHGRITQQITAAGATTDYTYDTQSNLATVTGPANNDLDTRPVTTYGYDALGRVTSVTDPLGMSPPPPTMPLGRALTVTLPKPTPPGRLPHVHHDVLRRQLGQLLGPRLHQRDRSQRQGHPAGGRPTRTAGRGRRRAGQHHHLRLHAKPPDLDHRCHNNNNVTSYAYDALKRLSQTTFPDTAYEGYTYYSDNLLHTKTDRKGQTITYAYDGLKRLSNKTYPGSSAITYAYQGQLLNQVTDTTISPTEIHSFTYYRRTPSPSVT